METSFREKLKKTTFASKMLFFLLFSSIVFWYWSCSMKNTLIEAKDQTLLVQKEYIEQLQQDSIFRFSIKENQSDDRQIFVDEIIFLKQENENLRKQNEMFRTYCKTINERYTKEKDKSAWDKFWE